MLRCVGFSVECGAMCLYEYASVCERVYVSVCDTSVWPHVLKGTWECRILTTVQTGDTRWSVIRLVRLSS